MRAFILGIIALIVIAGTAALISTSLDQSSRQAYQAHDSVRLSGR